MPPSEQMQTFEIMGWRDGVVVSEWAGEDEILARDACRKLNARGLEVEVFRGLKFLGWAEKGELPTPHVHVYGDWIDDPAGVVRTCACGAVDWRPEG